jgi:tRNA(fMet)-specific endonuclease VapC
VIYLLDTDLLIFLIRGLKAPHRRQHRQQASVVLERCRRVQTDGDSVGLSAVTVSELEFGARKSDEYEQEMAAVRKILAPFEIHDYDAVLCPPQYGRVRHELEAKGRSIGAMDLLIAAHALALHGALVTSNEAHFSRIEGLKVVNWLKAA